MGAGHGFVVGVLIIGELRYLHYAKEEQRRQEAAKFKN